MPRRWCRPRSVYGYRLSRVGGKCAAGAGWRYCGAGGARLSATLARIPAEIGCQLQQVFGMAKG